MNDQISEPIDSYEEDLFASPPPGWPKWIGGLAIAWGGLMLTCTGIGLVMLPMQSKFIGPMIEGAPMPDAFIVKPMDWAFMGIGLFLTFFLLFGGIFCVMRNPLSRLLILVWAIPSIPMSLYNYMVQMDKQASLQEWAKQYPDTQYAEALNQAGATGQQIGQIIGLVLTILLGVIVPAFFIIWFGFVKTKPEQMTGSEEVIA
jgi:hypothetical protein